jgi:hypothetical protein
MTSSGQPEVPDGQALLVDEQQYRVTWRSKITGFRGQGEPHSRQLAQAWADEGNQKYPFIEHWIEPV